MQMGVIGTVLFASLLSVARGCFVTTPDTAHTTADLLKTKAGTDSACWEACEATAACVGVDYRARTRDCWLKSELMGTAKVVRGIDTLTPCAVGVGLLAAGDRIAVSADGNFRDEDDIGATPMTLAMLVAAGVTDKLVYYGYRSHVWETETPRALIRHEGRSQDQRMTAAVKESIVEFGLDAKLFTDEKACFDATGEEAQAELVAAIDASGRDSRLWIIGAGPMQTIYKSLQAANRAALRHVVLVSHSISNNVHAEGHGGGVRWEEVKRLLINSNGSVHFGGRTCSGCIAPTVNKPHDQNKLLNYRNAANPLAVWTWLRDSPDPRLNFVFDKIKDSNVGDVSDAGMVYYILTGDENADPKKLRSLLSSMPPAPPACDCTLPVPDELPLAAPTIKDFVHRPAVLSSNQLEFTYVSEPAPGMTRWQQCVTHCIERYGADCLYVQFDRQTPEGTCIISRPCVRGAVCSKVSDVNTRGLDFNRVNCKRPEYLAVQAIVDSDVSACSNVF